MNDWRGIVGKVGDFAKSAVETLGERVKPHLRRLYEQSYSVYQSDYAKHNTPQDR